ncbi:MAG: hypothetical protein U9Q23_05715 [Candidatus Bipolaricaulota bacterium]|nr:hypothetical protein [Candidatus Bipolaricaulota bacterium]
MEITKAKKIVEALANGIDPITGEVFPKDSPYNHPDIIRALFSILHKFQNIKSKNKRSLEDKQRENIENGRPRNAGLPWNDRMKEDLAIGFKAGVSVDQLAGKLERTRGAIIAELKKQGLITAEEAVNDPAARPQGLQLHSASIARWSLQLQRALLRGWLTTAHQHAHVGTLKSWLSITACYPQRFTLRGFVAATLYAVKDQECLHYEAVNSGTNYTISEEALARALPLRLLLPAARPRGFRNRNYDESLTNRSSGRRKAAPLSSIVGQNLKSKKAAY